MMHVATAQVAVHEAEQVLAHLAAHAEEHDAVVRKNGRNGYSILVGANTIGLRAEGERLAVEVAAVSQSILFFLKEAAVQHLAELDAPAAESLRWETGPDKTACADTPPGFHHMRVTGKSEPMPGLIRLTLRTPDPAPSLSGPGIHVKLMRPVNPDPGSDHSPRWPQVAPNGTTIWPTGADALHVRYYTIRSADPETGEVEIDIVRHRGGLIADWADGAHAGDGIGLLGPGGGELPRSACQVLICGDQTALPAMARMLETLPTGSRGHLVGEAETREDLKDYLPDTVLSLHALPRKRFRSDIRQFCAGLTGSYKPEFAWFAGEHKNAQDMRSFFKSDLGLAKGDQFSIAFWRDGIPAKVD